MSVAKVILAIIYFPVKLSLSVSIGLIDMLICSDAVDIEFNIVHMS